MRIRTSKVAALRRYLTQDAKSDRLDSLTLAKMPLVDPEKLYAVDLPPAALQGLDRMTRQRARLIESLTGRKNRLQALLRAYLPGLLAVVGKPWEPVGRAVLAVSLNPFILARQDAAALRKALQDRLSRDALPEGLVPRLRTACGQLTRRHVDPGRARMIRRLKSGQYRLYSRKPDPKTGKRRNLEQVQDARRG